MNGSICIQRLLRKNPKKKQNNYEKKPSDITETQYVIGNRILVSLR